MSQINHSFNLYVKQMYNKSIRRVHIQFTKDKKNYKKNNKRR